MLPLPMPGPCFWPEEEASILATPFLSVSLLSITHPHLGAFCAEEGSISWVGYSEWGDLLGLGEGSQKWEEVRKLQVGPPSAQVPPSRVATMNPTLGSLLLSSKTLPAHTAFACLTLCPQPLLGSVYPPLCNWDLVRGPFGVPQLSTLD